MNPRGLLGMGLLLVVAAVDAWPQACPPEAPRRRTLAVNVFDERMQSVPGLTAANFRGEFRNQPVRVLSATLDAEPRRIVLLLDVSESMATRVGRWELAAAAAEHLLATGPPDSRVALVTFAETVEQRTRFDFDSREARKALQAARPGGGGSDSSGARTALRDAVVEAVRLLAPVRSGDAIYLITDGFDTFSRAKDEEVEAALAGSGVRLFVAMFPDWAQPGLFIEIHRGTLEMPSIILWPLAQVSGVPAPGVGESGGGGAVARAGGCVRRPGSGGAGDGNLGAALRLQRETARLAVLASATSLPGDGGVLPA